MTLWNLPVARKARLTRALAISATVGVPPRLTRVATRGPIPSRDTPNNTRDDISKHALTALGRARMTTNLTIVSPRGPKIACATLAAASVDPAIALTGNTYRNARLMSR